MDEIFTSIWIFLWVLIVNLFIISILIYKIFDILDFLDEQKKNVDDNNEESSD